MTLKQRLFAAARPFVRTYFRVTRPLTLGVRGMVFDGEGRILLVRHTYIPGWYMPGGGVERGETALQALTRELDEEAGVILLGAPKMVSLYANFREFKSDHVILYSIAAGDYEKVERQSAEIAESGYFSVDGLPADITPGTRRRIDEVVNGTPPAGLW